MSIGKIIAIIILPFLIPLTFTIAAFWTINLDAQNGIPHPSCWGITAMLLPSWIFYIGGVIGAKALAKDWEDYSLWLIILVPFISHIVIGFYIIALIVIGGNKLGEAWNS